MSDCSDQYESDGSYDGTAIKHDGGKIDPAQVKRNREAKEWKKKMAAKNRNPPARGQRGGNNDDKSSHAGQ